jgi:hypothetical protein
MESCESTTRLILGHPEIGLNLLQIGAGPGATVSVFVQAPIEAKPPKRPFHSGALIPNR